ncbi:MAG: SNF2-related protein [Planctomycetota bacterium]
MTDAENDVLAAGTKVRCTSHPEWGVGEVISQQTLGRRTQYRILFQGDGQFAVRVLFAEDIARATGPWEDAKAARWGRLELFELRQWAFLLPALNTGGEISNARTELLPHQILLTHRIANAKRRRILIADEVGLGKTIETGMVLRELMSRGEANRVLIVTPAGLTLNWLDELEDKFGLSPTVLGEDFDDSRFDAWERNPLAIASIDRLKRKERVRRLAQAPNWDVVVIDEAHHLSKYRTGRKVRSTQNYRLAEVLRQKTRDLLLLSATPHQGDEYHFYSLISLLDDQLFGSAEEIVSRRDKLDQLMIRRTKREVTDSEGRPLFAKRIVHTEGFNLSAAERKFYDALNDYLVEGYNIAESDPNNAEKRAVGFVMTTFQRLASSSPRAIRAALLKHLLRLLIRKANSLEEVTSLRRGRFGDRDELVRLRERSIELACEIWFFPNTEQGRLDAEQRILGEKRDLAKRRTKADIEEALEEAEYHDEGGLDVFEALYVGIPNEISKIEDLLTKFPDRIDRKLDRLLRGVDRLRAENLAERFIIFTQYRQTQEYLREHLGNRYGSDQVVLIKGGDIQAKRAAAAEFRRDAGARFLISTSAGGEGINLQVCRILFNYDLPWNPMAIEQRIGRIHRYGQQHTAQVYNLIATDTIEGQVHLHLQNKLERIAAAIGKVNEDGTPREDFLSSILGPLSERLDYIALYRDALVHKDFDRTTQEIEEAVKNAVQAGDVLDSLCQGLEPFNLDKFRAIRGDVTWKDLAEFVTRALAEVGAKFSWRDDVLTVELPEQFRQQAGIADHYDHLTFDRRRAMQAPDLELAGIGHPLVDALLAHFRAPALSGLTCVREVDDINGHRESLVQFNYLLRLHDTEGIRESLHVIPVADGREFVPELVKTLARRRGHSSTRSLYPPAEAKQIADAAMNLVLMQRLALEPHIPCEYHLDGVAVVLGR